MAEDLSPECTVQELAERRERGDGPVVLDVRTPHELEIASIDGVRHIPIQEIPERLSELEGSRDEEIIVMCHHGMRSARVQGFLLQQGFSKVRNLVGGIHAWSTNIDPSVPEYE